MLFSTRARAGPATKLLRGMIGGHDGGGGVGGEGGDGGGCLGGGGRYGG